jgi:hypothetical protein
VRHAAAQRVKAPKISYYTKEQFYKWLLEHPIAHPVDVTFLVKEEAEFKAEFKCVRLRWKGLPTQAKPTSHPIGSTTPLFFASTIVSSTTK